MKSPSLMSTTQHDYSMLPPSNLWLKGFNLVKTHLQQAGMWKLPPKVRRWCHKQRYQYRLLCEGKASQLSIHKLEMLNSIGFAFFVKKCTSSSTGSRIILEKVGANFFQQVCKVNKSDGLTSTELQNFVRYHRYLEQKGKLSVVCRSLLIAAGIHIVPRDHIGRPYYDKLSYPSSRAYVHKRLCISNASQDAKWHSKRNYVGLQTVWQEKPPDLFSSPSSYNLPIVKWSRQDCKHATV